MEERTTCLVTEGGALRGVYTSGVQGVLHREGICIDCVIGTSAGSMNAVNFLSGQPERSFHIDHHFARDKNFMGLRPLLREKQIFSFSYMYGPVNDAYPFDHDAFHASPTRIIAVCSDAETGRPVYLERTNCSNMLEAIKGSSSMPLVSTPIEIDGKRYYDGGPSMPVAHQKALEDGYKNIVLILTRQKGYRKKPLSRTTRFALKRTFRKSPYFYEMMLRSPAWYNYLMDEIDRLEEEGRIFVLRPTEPVVVSRTEKDQRKLKALFHLGRQDALERLEDLKAYLAR